MCKVDPRPRHTPQCGKNPHFIFFFFEGFPKFVLAARSEYFKKMFNDDHQFKESQENAVTIPCKQIVINKVIEYLYGGGDINIDGLAMVEIFEYLDLLRLMMLEEAFDIIDR